MIPATLATYERDAAILDTVNAAVSHPRVHPRNLYVLPWISNTRADNLLAQPTGPTVALAVLKMRNCAAKPGPAQPELAQPSQIQVSLAHPIQAQLGRAKPTSGV